MTIRVLLADDHTVFRDTLSIALDQSPDIEVVAAADSGDQAIELASKHRPHIVLLDISMEGLNGMETARRIRSQVPEANIIALTMHTRSRFILGMLEAGAKGYLPKTCAFEEVIMAIRRVHAGRRYLSPEVADVMVDLAINPSAIGETRGLNCLTSREREVLQMVAEGKTSKDIAARLNVGEKTIEAHRRSIMSKLDIHSIAALTKFAVKEGLTELE